MTDENKFFAAKKQTLLNALKNIRTILDLHIKILRPPYRKEFNMATSTVKAVFQNDIQQVWETVTSLKNYSWRSDLGRVKILNETQFIEYTKDGYATTFTITAKDPCKRWEFNLENDAMKGHWTGIFTQKTGGTEINFTESVAAKKIFMKPFVKFYLKKQQASYISDLKKALS